MTAPDKIYIGIDFSHTEQSAYIDYEGLHDVFSVEPELFDQWSTVPPPVESIEYIRKDLAEHIIRGALGPKDALNKIRSL